MISNERPSPFARWQRRPQTTTPYSRPAPYPKNPAYSKPPNPETTLKTERVQVERKTFVISLKENNRGRFLRIVEESNGHRDQIIVPFAGVEEFSRVLTAMVAPDDGNR
jgi:hypothetical protein